MSEDPFLEIGFMTILLVLGVVVFNFLGIIIAFIKWVFILGLFTASLCLLYYKYYLIPKERGDHE